MNRDHQVITGGGVWDGVGLEFEVADITVKDKTMTELLLKDNCEEDEMDNAGESGSPGNNKDGVFGGVGWALSFEWLI